MEFNWPICEVDWLFDHLEDPNLMVLDVSLPNPVQVTGVELEGFIPRAQVFDWNSFSRNDTTLPHMMLDTKGFTEAARNLGVNNSTKLVIYDRQGIYSSARVWWMFKVMGLKNAQVLNGGYPSWKEKNYPSVDHPVRTDTPGDFVPMFNESAFLTIDQIVEALEDENSLIIDLRSARRYSGEEAEPRAGVASGHIPKSINMPFKLFLNSYKIKEINELNILFKDFIDNNRRLIFSCGSGVTACIGALAATLVGAKNIGVYDGSWAEWGISGRAVDKKIPLSSTKRD